MIVIGAGAAGLSAARHLSKYNVKVIMMIVDSDNDDMVMLETMTVDIHVY